jgi:hypothetical protein
MSSILLAPDEIIELWFMQPTKPFSRWSRWVKANMWVPPLLLFLPPIYTNFEKTSVIFCLIIAIIYLVYGFITATVCTPWRQRHKLWIKKSSFIVDKGN